MVLRPSLTCLGFHSRMAPARHHIMIGQIAGSMLITMCSSYVPPFVTIAYRIITSRPRDVVDEQIWNGHHASSKRKFELQNLHQCWDEWRQKVEHGAHILWLPSKMDQFNVGNSLYHYKSTDLINSDRVAIVVCANANVDWIALFDWILHSFFLQLTVINA